MTTVQHPDGPVIDLLDDLREVSGVLGCGYPVVPPALRRKNAPDGLDGSADVSGAALDLSVLAGVLEGYEDYGS